MQNNHGLKKKEILLTKSVRLPKNIKGFLDEASSDLEVSEWLRNLITKSVEELPEYQKYLKSKSA